MPSGKQTPPEILDRIAQLLRDPELTITMIARRLDVGPSVVKSVNERLKIRTYTGNHATWTVNALPDL